MASLDIVVTLRHDAEQLMRMSEQSRFAGEGTAVRVLAPELLHAVMMDAADEIEDLRQARAAGERAGRAAALEEAAKVADDEALYSNQMISSFAPRSAGGSGEREMEIGARSAARNIAKRLRALIEVKA